MKLQDKNAHLFAFSGEIAGDTHKRFVSGFEKASAQGCGFAHLIVSSPGGQHRAAVDIYNYLSGLPFHLTTYNQDYTISAGTTIFLAGKHRIACAGATFGLHSVMAIPDRNALQQPTRAELEDMERRETEQLLEILRAGQVRLSETQLAAFKLTELRLSAHEALDCGLIHEIGDANFPGGIPFHLL